MPSPGLGITYFDAHRCVSLRVTRVAYDLGGMNSADLNRGGMNSALLGLSPRRILLLGVNPQFCRSPWRRSPNPEIVVAYGRDVFAVHRAKPACPVVFAFSGNPVDAGFVQSFAHPGGNFTGISLMSLDLAESASSCCERSYRMSGASRCWQGRSTRASIVSGQCPTR